MLTLGPCLSVCFERVICASGGGALVRPKLITLQIMPSFAGITPPAHALSRAHAFFAMSIRVHGKGERSGLATRHLSGSPRIAKTRRWGCRRVDTNIPQS